MLKTFLTVYLLISLNLPISATPNHSLIVPDFKPQTLLNPAPIPVQKTDKIAPIIEADISLALDINSGIFLYEKNIHQKTPIASLTKLMTAIIILEENELDEIVTVSQNAAETPGSKIWLFPGEKITVKNLLTATLIASANDAAVALAEHNADTETDFVKKMNQKAQKLGLKNTHFTNCVGFDHEENYSTGFDLTILGLSALKHPFIQKYVRKKHLTVTSINNQKHEIETTNKILGGFLNVTGLKTGHTENAGYCLLATAEGPSPDSLINSTTDLSPESPTSEKTNEENNQPQTTSDKLANRPILTLVINSPDRFQESKILINWVYESYLW